MTTIKNFGHYWSRDLIEHEDRAIHAHTHVDALDHIWCAMQGLKALKPGSIQ